MFFTVIIGREKSIHVYFFCRYELLANFPSDFERLVATLRKFELFWLSTVSVREGGAE